MINIIISILDNPDDQQYMNWVYTEFERLFFATALKYTDCREDAEDIVQVSIIKLIGKISVIRHFERCILGAYIVSTVRNTAINFLRTKTNERKRLEKIVGEITAQPQAEELPLDELMILAEKKHQLVDIWEDIPEEDRLLLEGKYILENSDEELAKYFGCKASSIRMKLTRARRNALKLIAECEVETI